MNNPLVVIGPDYRAHLLADDSHATPCHLVEEVLIGHHPLPKEEVPTGIRCPLCFAAFVDPDEGRCTRLAYFAALDDDAAAALNDPNFAPPEIAARFSTVERRCTLEVGVSGGHSGDHVFEAPDGQQFAVPLAVFRRT